MLNSERGAKMKILVLGATGGTGRLVIEQALARAHKVTAFVRNASGIVAKPGLKVVVGQLSDMEALRSVIQGNDAVLCCLGTHEKKNSDLVQKSQPTIIQAMKQANALRQKKNIDLMQKSLPTIIQAMKQANVLRLILLSAYGVGDTARTASFIARIAYKTVAAAIYQDKERSETSLPESGLQWTGIYPVMLTDDLLADTVDVCPLTQVQKVKGIPKVSRANVARSMLDAAENPGTIGQRLLVSSSGSVKYGPP
jgi:uncharacterized protein YbjT (DUF2867 family)